MNTNARHHVLLPHRQRGLSLIEMMVAVVLSLLLILGLVEIFGSTRAAFAASEGLARAQENSRFAVDFLRRDVRMAGHLGCLNEFGQIDTPETRFYNHFVVDGAALSTAAQPVRIDAPLDVYEFTGSIPGSNYAITSSTPPVAPAASAWTPALPTALGLVAAGTGGIIAGSDVLVVRYFSEAPITLSAGPTATTVWPLGQGGVGQTSGTIYLGQNAPNVVLNAVYGITNCKAASLFQVTSTGPTTVGSENGQNLVRAGEFWDAKEVYGVGAMMFRYQAVVYYVGRGANGNPSLFRRSLPEAPATSAAGVAFAPVSEEVVEGVEMMQILLATADVPTASGRLDDVTAYQSATALLAGATTADQRAAAMRRVGTVRASLLMRSPGQGAGLDPASPTVVVGDVRVTPPVDRRVRQVYDSLILLRNRQRA
jgi:type IV pilus assembly protein PilW